ncbi:MAG: DUF2325 domain-containing protein [Nitrosospira sp.]|nr:DUF2325 domain-containing protein [Nitrosospira sp.]
MKRIKKATSSIAPPFLIAQTPPADEILLACLHGAESTAASLSAHLPHGPIRDVVSAVRRHDAHDAHDAHDSHGFLNAFSGRMQTLLEKKFGPIIKQFLKTHGKPFLLKPTGLTKTARLPRLPRLQGAAPGVTERKSTDRQQALLKRIDMLERELADAKARITHETGWVPLIKVSAAPAAASIAAHTRGCSEPDRIGSDCKTSDPNVCDQTRARACANLDLAGRCILCVGGRAKLYPEYRRLVETSGGSLLIYRSGLKNDADILSTLFDCADMVVCPADCVNHDAYFAVKRYCKRSGKACVLLDRSNLPTFRKGVETLAALAASPVVAR